MMAAERRVSAIERVPPLMVALLEKAGDLPALPAEFAVNQNRRCFRKPTLVEGGALTWLLAWVGPKTEGFMVRKPSGVAGYQDHYDFHSASDVREVCYLAGTARACVDLLREIHRTSHEDGRRMMGAIDAGNGKMAWALRKLFGVVATRIVFEDSK